MTPDFKIIEKKIFYPSNNTKIVYYIIDPQSLQNKNLEFKRIREKSESEYSVTTQV